uniref:Uncharacterized protein n=1 Tax=Ditylenchus dipsaci TaxID=166011 RepID=A0A915EP43_9BILA
MNETTGKFQSTTCSTGSSTAHQMEMFKKKTSGSSSTTSSLVGYSGGQGPIMKIQEKTEKSMPMFKKPVLKQLANSSSLSSPLQSAPN